MNDQVEKVARMIAAQCLVRSGGAWQPGLHDSVAIARAAIAVSDPQDDSAVTIARMSEALERIVGLCDGVRRSGKIAQEALAASVPVTLEEPPISEDWLDDEVVPKPENVLEAAIATMEEEEQLLIDPGGEVHWCDGTRATLEDVLAGHYDWKSDDYEVVYPEEDE
jgi:hypothetical protein